MDSVMKELRRAMPPRIFGLEPTLGAFAFMYRNSPKNRNRVCLCFHKLHVSVINLEQANRLLTDISEVSRGGLGPSPNDV